MEYFFLGASSHGWFIIPPKERIRVVHSQVVGCSGNFVGIDWDNGTFCSGLNTGDLTIQNDSKWVFNMIYPLVNIQKTMENHRF